MSQPSRAETLSAERLHALRRGNISSLGSLIRVGKEFFFFINVWGKCVGEIHQYIILYVKDFFSCKKKNKN